MRLFFALAIVVALCCACSKKDEPAPQVAEVVPASANTPAPAVSAPHFTRAVAVLRDGDWNLMQTYGSYPAPHPKGWGGAAFDPVAFDKWLQTHNPQPKKVESRRPP